MRAGNWRRAAGLLLVAGALAAAAPAGAVAGARVVGGPLLATGGVVVRPLPGAPPLPGALTAAAWLVADDGTGEVLAARDPHGRFLPASTLKVLTAVTLLPRLNPRALVSVPAFAAAVDGTRVGLVPGYRYTVQQLFTAMLIASGNDAADTLAYAAGGVPRTLALMNAQARALGADDTWAGTPSGLDAPGEATSAYDLALIARAGLRIPAFRRYLLIRVAYLPRPDGPPYQISTHDRLLLNYPGAIGVKNGFTEAAQSTYIGAATRDGRTLLATVLHATDGPQVWTEAAALLTWGFAAEPRVRPVGWLVQPAAAAPRRAATAARRSTSPRAVHPAAAAAGGLPALPVAGAVALAAAGLVSAVALRRRRRGPVRSTGR